MKEKHDTPAYGSWAIILFAFFMGIEFELESWQNSALMELDMGQSAGLLLIPVLYCAFIFWALLALCPQLKTDCFQLILIYFLAIFSTGWLVAGLNDGSAQLVETLLGQGMPADYLNAFAGALVEEGVKLLMAILLLFAFKRRDPLYIFMVGALVGLAFQLSEDINYIFMPAEDGTYLSQALTRLAGAFSAHWAYSAIAASGWASVRAGRLKSGIILMALPVLLHGLWNSPLNSQSLSASVLSVLTLLLFIYCHANLPASQEK